MMEGIDLPSVYTTIGQVLGTPAVLALFYLFNKQKEQAKELEAIKLEFNAVKTDNNEMKKSLSSICENVAFMRGLMEGQAERAGTSIPTKEKS